MEKMKMHTPNQADENFRKLSELFPNAVTESITGYDENGKAIVERSIDKDILMQEISANVIEGREERYQFTWPDKRKAVLAANAPIAATLRPVQEESVGKDGTPGGWDSHNLYIEGDNLDVLKLLQEAYLGKIKLIYIDPPYNTGNDFVYEDDFSERMTDYSSHSGQYDKAGNRLVQNKESNGRFHTDWLNMIYPRIKIAKNLLSDDGFIFISIDENEVDNMIKICNEVFGEENQRNIIAVRRGIKNVQAQFETVSSLSQGHEYLLFYAKRTDSRLPKLSNEFAETKQGKWDTFWRGTDRPTMRYQLFGKTPETGQWRWEKGRADRAIQNYKDYLNQNEYNDIDDYFSFMYMTTGNKPDFLREYEGKIQYYVPPQTGKLLSDNWMDIMMTGSYTIFDTEKSLDIMTRIIEWITTKDDIILDFFSGSATTAHAVMQSNIKTNSCRRFILVQINQAIKEGTTIYKAGFRDLCEIGKERIRRAGQELKKENGLIEPIIDIGFRVLHLDSSNMQDVYYCPDELSRDLLGRTVDNIKIDRTPEDLLFQVMLDLGVDLSSSIVEQVIDGKTVFMVKPEGVDREYLIACFDKGVTSETVTAIAKMQPYYAVFRDSGMASDSVATNFDQIFRTYSPQTERKVL
ncbi:MAG: site-specific DNA-methyltransferase [Clostridia bacterium]|nr:site-specific DNA-methyltransferase [Clostridia bacterium]MBR4577769.1 site-specific DNA-methyltransferase [Clostridia bacterium]